MYLVDLKLLVKTNYLRSCAAISKHNVIVFENREFPFLPEPAAKGLPARRVSCFKQTRAEDYRVRREPRTGRMSVDDLTTGNL